MAERPVLDPLVSGLVHDVGNLLLAIGWSAGAEERRPALPAETRQGLEEIRELSRRALALLRFFRDLHGGAAGPPAAVDLATLLADGAGMLRRLLGEDVHLRTAVDPGAGKAWVDPARAGLLVVALLRAGRELVRAGGSLALEIAGPVRDEAALEAAPGGAWMVLRARAEDGAAGALGEGAATTRFDELRRLVEESGGRVAPPAAAEAAVIEVYLPLAVETGAEAAEPEEIEAPAGAPTILLAEDEPAVRKLLARALRHAGFHVLEATGTDEALTLALAEGGRVDLLVSDVVLPGRGGAELAARLSELIPRLKVLLMSGYPGDRLASWESLPAGAQFLAKPFLPAELVAKVREMLAGPYS